MDRHSTPMRLAVLAAMLLAAPAAPAPSPTPIEFSGSAFLPYGCEPTAKFSGPATADGLINDARTALSAFDVFPKGYQAAQCPPPRYGFAGQLTATVDPSVRGVEAELSMERCQLTPAVSTDIEPVSNQVDEYPDFAHGSYLEDARFTSLKLRGDVHLWRKEEGSGGFFEYGCGKSWSFEGVARTRKPSPPPPGEEDELPDLPQGPKVKSRSGAKKAGGKASLEAAPAALVSLQPCPAKTLCLGKAGSSRADVLVRNVPQFDGSQTLAYLTLTASEVEVWRWLPGQTEAQAVSWLFPALKGSKTANGGLLDTWDLGFDLEQGQELTSLVREALAVEDGAEAVGAEPAAAAPKPPSKKWVSSPVAPGFRFQARFGDWLGLVTQKIGVTSTVCPAETTCFGRTAAEPATIFVRLLAGKNGARSPILAKFATEPVEVWIEQTAKKRVRYYRLEGTLPDALELDGRLDPDGFPKS